MKEQKRLNKMEVDDDTYSMAFKAHHFSCIAELDLKPDEISQSFYSVIFVFGIQLFLIFFLGMIIFNFAEGLTFEITMPDNLTVLGARFVCSILMHLNVEADVRKGLRMMKYNCNHRSEFIAPTTAFMVGFL